MVIVVLLSLLVLGSANTCHYSCLTCTGPQYVSCLSCPTGNFTETVEDTTVMPSQYWSSVYPSGTCVATFAPTGNILGIIFLLLIVGVCLFFRTKESFYLLLTFQTYGLYNLVELAWLNPLGYVLQGLQYLMIFNTMGYGYKKEDYILIASKNYRLNKYLQTTSIASNLAIIAAFTLVPLIILIIISVISCRKARKPESEQKKKEAIMFQAIAVRSEQSKRELQEGGHDADEEKNQSCFCWKHFSEEVLIKIAKFLLCFLFLMVQQTCLVLLVTLVYQSPVSRSIIALCIVYLHILVFVMSYSYYYRIEYFKEKNIMYLTFAQKIIMPVMIVVPIEYQYVFFIFAVVFLILEFVFDKYNGLYRSFSRLAIYKVVEMLTVVILTVYFIVERKGQSMSSSKAASIAGTFVMILNLLIFAVVELPMSIKDKYFPSKTVNDEAISEKQVEKIIQEDTLDNLDPDSPDKNKMNVLILEHSHDSDQDENKNGKNKKDARTGANTRNNSSLDKNDTDNEQQRLERERQEKERQERERQERERQERERQERERQERERQQREKEKQERLQRERLDQERKQKEMIEKEKREKEKRERERKQRERLEKEKREKEKAEQERLERERKEREQAEEEAQREAERKRKRKQIIDPELRMRYGI